MAPAPGGRGPDEGAALTSFPSTTGEQPAEGDRSIHQRDLALLQRADCECPLLPVRSSGVNSLNTPGLPAPPPRHLSLTSPDTEPQSRFFFPVIVAEVTQPSLRVGYEVGRAMALNKRILCLFRPKSGRGEHSKPWMPTPPTPAEHPALSSLSWGL